jgi:hypothetical protein
MRREALLVRRGTLCTLKKKLVRKFYKHVFGARYVVMEGVKDSR